MNYLSLSQQRADIFNALQTAASAQATRLLTENPIKAEKILNAINRLGTAILYLNQRKSHLCSKLNSFTAVQIDFSNLEKMNLETVDQMFDAVFAEWGPNIEKSYYGGIGFESTASPVWIEQISLRTALNIAKYNIFNFSGDLGPLYGKSNALTEAEKQVQELLKLKA